MSPIEVALEHGKITGVSPMTQLWLLRILVLLGVSNELITTTGFACHRIPKALGFLDLIDLPEDDFVPSIAHTRLGQLHRQFEGLERHQPELFEPEPTLAGNIQELSNFVGLKDEEVCILYFAVQLNSSRELDNATDMLGPLSSAKLFECLGAIIEMPTELVHQTLSTQAILASSGLLSVDRASFCNMRSKLHLRPNTFADSMLSGISPPYDVGFI